MESSGVVPQFCWDTLDEQMQLDDMARLLESHLLGRGEQVRDPGIGSIMWPYDEADAYRSPWSNDCSNLTCHLNDPYASPRVAPINATGEDQLAPSLSFFQVDQHEFIAGSEQSSLKKRKLQAAEFPSETPRKMARASSAVQKNLKSKNASREEHDGALNAQSASSCSSEDDYPNASREGSAAPGKARAGRGAATDPQSLYARKRRERINERLRILQNLVPNGTKVDISTMLEEAVEYVKFLQHQIKLLSSDELWMYSPLAYKGMNIGQHLMIPSNKQ